MKTWKKLAGGVLLPLLCAAVLVGALTVGKDARAVSTVTARLRPDYTIVIDGATRTFYNVSGQQVYPVSYQDTTYLPVRAIGELMGKIVSWDEAAKTVTLSGVRTGGATTGTPAAATVQDITLEVRDDFTVVVDGTARTFADANGKTVYPLLYQGSTYLPVRAVGELMGKSVSWDEDAKTITLSGAAGSTVTDADVIVPGGTAPAEDPKDAGGLISAEDAKAKALAHAGLTANEVTFIQQKLEWEDGRQVYDIEFYTASSEYDYEIDASTGEIVSFDYDAESYTPPAGGAGGVTAEKAQEIALAKVPGAKAEHVKKLKLDRDDGKQVYEVEIVYNGMEYEMEIDASSGTILEFAAESTRK